MASVLAKQLLFLIILTIAAILFPSNTKAQHDDMSLQIVTEALEWSTNTSVNDGFGASEEEDEDGDAVDGISMEGRSLYWRHSRRRYYISYAALSANHVPCQPRSGRSYYTRNCHKASGPVRPYYRGCSAISRCERRF